MSQYNIIAESAEYTVVSEYEHAVSTSEAYQSEADLEKEFIRLLGEQGYEYLPIHTEADLVSNLRTSLEKLNDYHSPTMNGSTSSTSALPTRTMIL